MSAKDNIISSIAGRYAAALFDLAHAADPDRATRIGDDMARLAQAIADNPDLQTLLRSPIIPAAEQAAALDAVLEKLDVDPLMRNFVALTVRRRRVFALAEMARLYDDRMREARNELTADVVSAQPLKPEQCAALEAQLAGLFGKTVKLETSSDPDLLGGMVVRIASRQIDTSLNTRLSRLQSAIE